MRTFIQRLGAVSLLLAFSMALAACGNKEAEQRTTFIDLPADPRARQARPARAHAHREEKTSFGDYAQHYAVITDFNEGMNQSVSQPMGDVMAKGALRSIGDLASRRDDLKAAKDGLGGLRTALDQQVAKADAAHAKLKQPDDLKQVYDKAYDKTVTHAGRHLQGSVPRARHHVRQRAGHRRLSWRRTSRRSRSTAASVTVTDPAVQAELNKMLQQLNGQSAAINAAQRKMQAMVRGS
jgi:hypothetical protein